MDALILAPKVNCLGGDPKNSEHLRWKVMERPSSSCRSLAQINQWSKTWFVGPPKNDPTSVSSLVKLSKPTQTPEWDSTPKSDPPNEAYSTIHYLGTFGGRISWQKFHLRTSYCAWQLLGTARFPILWCHRKCDFTWKNGDMGVWKVWWHTLLAVILMEKMMINHPIWGCPIFLSKPDEKLLRRYETKVVPSLGFWDGESDYFQSIVWSQLWCVLNHSWHEILWMVFVGING